VRGQPGQLLLELGEGELGKIAVWFSDNTHVGRLANGSDSTRPAWWAPAESALGTAFEPRHPSSG
jgi:hypothetical protein